MAIKLSCNLGFFFQSEPLLKRLELAHKFGFGAVELAFDQYECDIREIAQTCHDLSLHVELINTPKGRWEQGERGLAAVPKQEERFWRMFLQSVDCARALKCKKIHVMSGVCSPDEPLHRHFATIVQNLTRAAAIAEKEDLILTLEPISTIPGYYMNHVEIARAVIEAVSSPRIKYQYDCFHAHAFHSNILTPLERNIDILGHVQISGVPDRQEPSVDASSSLIPVLFRILESVYGGYVGCEYTPSDQTNPDLSWAQSFIT
eukprot:gene2531-5451_t